MAVAAIVLAVVLAALAVGALLPWRLKLAGQGRGQPDGAWALGGGAQLLVLSATAARARGTPTVVEVRALGRSIVRRMFPSPNRAKAPEELDWDGLGRRYDRLAKWVDPLDLLLFVADETGRLSIRDLEGSLRFGLRDVDVAGKLAGALAVLSALGSPFGRFRHQIDWSGSEHFDASFSLTIRFSPALIAWDTARFTVRSLRARRAHRRAPRPLRPEDAPAAPA